jgi:hypothetical protein
MSVVRVVCCQVEVSATSWSLVQRSPTECGVSKVCDREMRRARPLRGCRAIGRELQCKSCSGGCFGRSNPEYADQSYP